MAILAALLVLGHGANAARAAVSCDRQVLTDWSDNGRVDGAYPLRCYERAIDTLPVDLRDYTNAAEVIGRALTAAVRTSAGRTADGATPAASPEVDAAAMPLVPLGGAAFTLAMLVAGGTAYVARRRRAR